MSMQAKERADRKQQPRPHFDFASLLRRAVRAGRARTRRHLREYYLALHALRLRHGTQKISAMMRVKNEEEFLAAAVESIQAHVEEIVIVDNLSTDRTPEIIARLRAAYPDKVIAYQYPFEIKRAGRENAELVSSVGGRSSPHLLANYYNWCLERCSKPFVLKWDGDMIATAALGQALRRWRRSGGLSMYGRGANVHPDFTHLIAEDPRYRGYTRESPLTQVECWLFPKWRVRFESNDWCEYVAGPLLDHAKERRRNHHIAEVLFLHLKLCKKEPFSNVSTANLLADGVLTSTVPAGADLTEEFREIVRTLRPAISHLTDRRRSAEAPEGS
jgi:hypothetical protein